MDSRGLVVARALRDAAEGGGTCHVAAKDLRMLANITEAAARIAGEIRLGRAPYPADMADLERGLEGLYADMFSGANWGPDVGCCSHGHGIDYDDDEW